MTCKNCGNDLPESAKFCNKCGAKAEKERKCSQCGNILSADDAFCMECGTKAGVPNPAHTPLQTDAASAYKVYSGESKQTGNTESQYGRMAIIGENLYFLGRNREVYSNSDVNTIYVAPLDGKIKAQNLFDPKDKDTDWESLSTRFAIQDIFNSQNCYSDTDFPTIRNEMQLLERFYASDNNLYFVCSIDGITADCACDLCSYKPSTRELKTIYTSIDINTRLFCGIYKGKAYYLTHMRDNSFVEIDLSTGELIKKSMPKVTLGSWLQKDDYGIFNKKWIEHINNEEDFINSWQIPIIRSGYAYTSGYKGGGYDCFTLRFPVSNPEAFELLPFGVYYKRMYVDHSYIAESNNTLMLPFVYKFDEYLDAKKMGVCAIDKLTLSPIEGIDWRNGGVVDATYIGGSGCQLGSKLAVRGKNDKSAIFDINEQVCLGNADGRYVDMYDAVTIGDTIYAIGSGYYSKLCNKSSDNTILYKFPIDFPFNNTANPDDYAHILF